MNKKELEETLILAKAMDAGLIGWCDLTEYQTALLKELIGSDSKPVTCEKVEHQCRNSL